jgi:hypothetical protein
MRAEVLVELEAVGITILVKNVLIFLAGTAAYFRALVLRAGLWVCRTQFFLPAKLSPTENLHSRHQQVLDASCSPLGRFLLIVCRPSL